MVVPGMNTITVSGKVRVSDMCMTHSLSNVELESVGHVSLVNQLTSYYPQWIPHHPSSSPLI